MPPSDASPYASDLDALEHSRHESHQSKRSTQKKKGKTTTFDPTPNDEMVQKLKQLTKQVEALEFQRKKILYTKQDLCPNLFDKSLYMPPFPKHFETSRFDKYQGKGNPLDHIKEFCASCMEIGQEQTYLLILFPKILSGPTPEWYSKLFGNIKSWNELA